MIYYPQLITINVLESWGITYTYPVSGADMLNIIQSAASRAWEVLHFSPDGIIVKYKDDN